METRLLPRCGKKRALGCDGLVGAVAGRGQGAVELDLEALCELVIELNDGLELVERRPCLRERKAILLVGVLGLKVANDRVGLPVKLLAKHAERNIGRSLGLDLERRLVNREVLVQQVVGSLAKILLIHTYLHELMHITINKQAQTFQTGGTGCGAAIVYVC